MSVHDDFQGQGVGTELMAAMVDFAENWLNIRRIELQVYTDNEPGIALYKKFGFEVEGAHRNYSFREGQHVDSYTMARLRE
jgi:putative acetyltransferase